MTVCNELIYSGMSLILHTWCAAEDGQKLYVRLFLRKHRWIRKSKIVYNEIACDLSSVLDHVTTSGLIADGMFYVLEYAHRLM